VLFPTSCVDFCHAATHLVSDGEIDPPDYHFNNAHVLFSRKNCDRFNNLITLQFAAGLPDFFSTTYQNAMKYTK
jgi:hypothetical protein